MRKFKRFDVWFNCVLILLSLTLAMVNSTALDWMYGYFIVGGWQIISMLVHAKMHWFTDKRSFRIIYHHIVAAIIALAIAGIYIPDMLYLIMVSLLFIAPIMAISYTLMCYREYRLSIQRPLALLK